MLSSQHKELTRMSLALRRLELWLISKYRVRYWMIHDREPEFDDESIEEFLASGETLY